MAHVKCPHCQQLSAFPAIHPGQVFTCPFCRQAIRIPAAPPPMPVIEDIPIEVVEPPAQSYAQAIDQLEVLEEEAEEIPDLEPVDEVADLEVIEDPVERAQRERQRERKKQKEWKKVARTVSESSVGKLYGPRRDYTWENRITALICLPLGVVLVVGGPLMGLFVCGGIWAIVFGPVVGCSLVAASIRFWMGED